MRNHASVVIKSLVAVAVLGLLGLVAVKFGSSTTSNPLSSLPLIPWEGGPDYWAQFPITKAAGWTNPNFFPIVVTYDGVSGDAAAAYDKSIGINSYIGYDNDQKCTYFADNGTFLLSGVPANSTCPANTTTVAGDFLLDEPDGQHANTSLDLQAVQQAVASAPDDGRFKEINFTGDVISAWDKPDNYANFTAMVNAYAGPASVDDYFYTMPTCNVASMNFIVPMDQGHCRTSSSYGAEMRALRIKNAEGGGPLKPLWNYVEDLSENGRYYITPGQLQGAVMDSIINEARGILYFNQVMGKGTCNSGNVVRDSQVIPGFCGDSQIAAMKHVDGIIRSLAPVLNSQSYQYKFGTNLDTMLKWYNGSVYIFAMISGAASSQPGSRVFTLPPGLANTSSVTVLNENRTLPVSNGTFTDSFAAEYTYHIYKITP